MCPNLQALELLGSWDGKLFGILLLLSLFIDFEEALWYDLRAVLDSGELGSQIVSFLAWEWWHAVNRCIQVSSKKSHKVLG